MGTEMEDVVRVDDYFFNTTHRINWDRKYWPRSRVIYRHGKPYIRFVYFTIIDGKSYIAGVEQLE